MRPRGNEPDGLSTQKPWDSTPRGTLNLLRLSETRAPRALDITARDRATAPQARPERHAPASRTRTVARKGAAFKATGTYGRLPRRKNLATCLGGPNGTP